MSQLVAAVAHNPQLFRFTKHSLDVPRQIVELVHGAAVVDVIYAHELSHKPVATTLTLVFPLGSRIVALILTFHPIQRLASNRRVPHRGVAKRRTNEQEIP